MKFLATLAALSVAVTVPAHANTTAAPAAQAAKTKRVCTIQETTGSRVGGKRICQDVPVAPTEQPATPATAKDGAAPAVASTSVPKPAVKPAKPKRICTIQETTGSRVGGKRVCQDVAPAPTQQTFEPRRSNGPDAAVLVQPTV